MQFLIKDYDGDGMLEKRMEVRPRHLEGMKVLGKQIICAGGLLDDEGRMKGSALVMEFENRAALDEVFEKLALCDRGRLAEDRNRNHERRSRERGEAMNQSL